MSQNELRTCPACGEAKTANFFYQKIDECRKCVMERALASEDRIVEPLETRVERHRQEKEVRKLMRYVKGALQPLPQIAKRAGGRQARFKYPDIQAKVLGPVSDIIYHTSYILHSSSCSLCPLWFILVWCKV